MQSRKIPNSLIAIYFSKQNIGVAHFDKANNRIQCGLIQYWIYTSKHKLSKIIEERMVDMLLTNNSKHSFLYQYQETIKIATVDQRGLQDDVIQNNICMLKFNPIKQPINNKTEYAKLMREHSEGNGLNKQKYKALGMLIYYILNENQFSLPKNIYLNDISYFFDLVFKHVQITSSQLEQLQISKQQVHPSFIKGKGRSKQGFSVLSLYQTPLSSAGSKKILKNIFRNPTYDREILNERMIMIGWIKENCNDVKGMLKIFRNIHSADTIINKFVDSRVQLEDWKKLVRTLQSMIILHKILQQKMKNIQQTEIPNFLNVYFGQINWGEIAHLLSLINNTFDINQGTIKRGVNSELDNLKKIYDNLPHLLTLYAKNQNWSDDFRIVFMTQIGYLIRVPHQVQIPPQLSGGQWILQFVENSGKFYCNQLTQMLDNEYGDVYGQISDKEKRIIFQLQNIISESYQTIELAYWKTCQIQCSVGISIVSNGMCKPRISSQSFIVSKGWHLLLAQDAIDNNAFSFDQTQAPKQRIFNSQQNLVNINYSNRIVLISGPNGSGKTIYMKQVAIIIYLTHLGFFIPAQFAQIPLSKRSIYRGSNGFESQIASLSRVMTPGMFTNKSIILIDELGASIDNMSAKKILLAFFKFIADPKMYDITKNEYIQTENDKFNIPMTISITHLTDIVSNCLIEQSYNFRCLTMDMQKDQTYLFKIKPGLVRKGYGIECARGFMGQQFTKRAQKYWQDIKFMG